MSGDDLTALRGELARLALRDLHAYVVTGRLVVRRSGGEWCEICNPAATLAALRALPDGAGVDAAWEAL